MFPENSIKEKDLVKAISQSGAYRLLGDTIVMTPEDVKEFKAWLRTKRLRRVEPTSDSPGLFVVLGGRPSGGDYDLTWVGWCREGAELDLLDRVQLGSQERLTIHHTSSATYEEVASFRVRNARDCWYGQWFRKSKPVLDEIQSRVDTEEKE